MTVIPYQRIHPEELADLEAKYGRDLSEREALYLLRQEREKQMREQIFYGTEPCRTDSPHWTGSSGAGLQEDSNRNASAEMPTVPSRITTEQIVDVSRQSWRLPLLILLAMIVGECWLAAHYINVFESWFR